MTRNDQLFHAFIQEFVKTRKSAWYCAQTATKAVREWDKAVAGDMKASDSGRPPYFDGELEPEPTEPT